MKETRRITINIAGRRYPLNVPIEEEETLRKVGKEIERMIKDFEANFAIQDKQDVLAMCALKLGTNAEVARLNANKNIEYFQNKLSEISLLLEDNR